MPLLGKDQGSLDTQMTGCLSTHSTADATSTEGIKSKSKTFTTRCLLTVSSEGAAIKPARDTVKHALLEIKWLNCAWIQSEGATEDNQSCSQNCGLFPLAYCSLVISHLIFQCLICWEAMTEFSTAIVNWCFVWMKNLSRSSQMRCWWVQNKAWSFKLLMHYTSKA